MPYVMVKKDTNLTGNARFEGFCIDLLSHIARQVEFDYVIQLVPDNVYGVYDPETKKWNGIVKELKEKVRWKSFLIKDCSYDRPDDLSARVQKFQFEKVFLAGKRANKQILIRARRYKL